MSNGERGFTQWSPDTCGCILQYYNDDISHHATVQACDKHKANAGTAKHLDDVLAHNRKKNAVMGHLKEQHGIDPTPGEGQTTNYPGVSANYDPNAPVGNDPVIIYGLADILNNTASKGTTSGNGGGGGTPTVDDVQASLDATFGAGTVVIQ